MHTVLGRWLTATEAARAGLACATAHPITANIGTALIAAIRLACGATDRTLGRLTGRHRHPLLSEVAWPEGQQTPAIMLFLEQQIMLPVPLSLAQACPC